MITDSSLVRLAEQTNAHNDAVKSIGFSLDGTRIVSGSVYGSIKLWGGRFAHSCVLFAVRQRWAVADMRTCLWAHADASMLALIQKLPNAHSHEVNSVGFSPSGTKILSVASDNSVKLWGGPPCARVRVRDVCACVPNVWLIGGQWLR